MMMLYHVLKLLPFNFTLSIVSADFRLRTMERYLRRFNNITNYDITAYACVCNAIPNASVMLIITSDKDNNRNAFELFSDATSA